MYTFISQVDELRRIISPGDDICPYYLIDRQSRVYSEYSGLELKQVVTENGYKAVSLNTISGKRIQRRVHRLSMFTYNYFPGCENFQVNHKNGNKFNNDLDNLEWMTPKENIQHALENGLKQSWKESNNPQAKINSEQAIMITQLVLQGLSNEDIIDIIPEANDSIVTQIILGNCWNSVISDEIVNQMRMLRYPVILSIEQKHLICRYYQDYICPIQFKGSIKQYIERGLLYLNIPLNESTFRMAKRLYYKYQDPDITSLYNY